MRIKMGFLVMALALMPWAQAQEGAFYAVTIGTGMPLPNPDRACAATLIVAGDQKILVDTGRGTLGRLAESGHLDIDAILYTHFHNDHISEFGEILVNRAIAGATEPMSVHGPAGTQAVTDALLAPYALDTEYRIEHHGDKYAAAAMTAEVSEHEPGVIFDAEGLVIRMFMVDHEPIEPAVGYRFEYGGKSIVVSGDTKKSAALQEAAKDCDLLIHEAVNKQIMTGVMRGMQQSNPRQAKMIEELMDYHTDTTEIAEIARDAGVKKVVLTHLVPSIPPTDAAEKRFVTGMDAIYGGEILVARDGMKFEP